jgi:DNA-binding HxlR family transcriptional regulator
METGLEVAVLREVRVAWRRCSTMGAVLMPKSSRRSVCPVACTLDLVGDRWTLLVVRDLFAGKTHYHEFAESHEGIATNILAARLDRLCTSGLVHATPSKVRAGSRSYELTERGRSLRPVLETIRDWGLENISGTAVGVRVP